MNNRIIEILKENQRLWNEFTFSTIDYLNDEYKDTTKIISDHFYTDPYMSNFLVKEDYTIDYPDHAKFAVCLTHDVDDVYPPLRHALASSINHFSHLDFQSLREQYSWLIKGKSNSPYMNFEDIIDLEGRFNAKSSFYFLATDSDVSRFRYRIEDLNNIMGTIIDKGCEVGLHGGYYAYDDPNLILAEKKRLEKVINRRIIGYRNHYLRFKLPDTWEFLASAGFKYDTTIGNNRIVGFKNGLCHPFKPFNIKRNDAVDLVEIPLVLSDFTVMNANCSPEKRWEISKSIIDGVEKCGGVLTVLWHSDVLNNSYHSDWLKFYIKILEYCHNKNAWITSGEEIFNLVNKCL